MDNKISESVYVTEHDKEVFKELEELEIEMIHQPLPGDERQDFMKLLGGK